MESKKIRLMIILIFTIILSLICSNKALAYSKVDENEIRYVNATLTKINGNEYNTKMRGMSLEEYWNYSEEERKNIDQRYMLFGSAGVPGVSVISAYNPPNQNAGKLFQGLASEKLVNNNLWISRFNNGESFFPTESYASANSNLYTEILRNWKFPFRKEANGYYSFNSDDYIVQRNYNTKKLEMYTGSHYCFYPFNNLGDDCTDVHIRQYFYTMRLDIPYVMTSEGKINGEDMIFNFAGDDDVWVYIDGRLAVDIGGAHPRATGNLNFATNTAYYADSYDFQAKTVYNVLNEEQKREGQHTLTIFYMDRGDGESNFISRFNLQSGGIKVNYLDKSTGAVLNSEIKTGVEGSKISLAAKEISGYTLIESPQTQEYIMTDNIQTVNYYYSKDSKVNVRYVDSISGQDISEPIIISGYEGKEYATEKKNISNYVFLRNEGKTSGKMSRQESIVTYYYAKVGSVKVNYIDKANNATLESQIIEGYVGKSYTTQQKTFDNYTYLSNSSNVTGTMLDETIQVNYYYAKNTKVIVKYVDKATNQEISESVVINGYEGKEYITNKKQVQNYMYVETNGQANGKMPRESIVVTYKYLYNSKLTVNYIDKSTGAILSNEIKRGLETEKVNTTSKLIEGYTLIERPSKEQYTLTKNEQIVNYYYAKNTKITVRYIDKLTNNKLANDVIIEGYEGKSYKTENKEFENFVLAGIRGQDKGTMQREECTIIYNYLYKENIIVNYIDKKTGQTLEADGIRGVEGDKGNISAKKIEGYTLIDKPSKEQYTITKQTQTFNYYYAKDTKVTIKYINEVTGREIATCVELQGYEGKEYNIEKKDIENYIYLRVEGETHGTMKREESTIVFYYAMDSKVKVNHLEKDTNIVLDEEIIHGYQGKEYKTNIKDISNYTYVSNSSNTQGIMSYNTIEVNYYYLQNTSIEVRHIDKVTGKIMSTNIKKGIVGDKINTSKKEIEGYTLIERPSKEQYTLTKKEQIVNYYYAKDSKITVKYIDKTTKKELEKEDIIEGYEGKSYETKPKDIKDYVMVELQGKDKGIMIRENIVITYYYLHIADGVIEKHIDIMSNEVLEQKTYEGKEGESYSTQAKEFKEYDLVKEKIPQNATGKMTIKPIEVKYYYIRKSQVIVNYIDKITNKLIDTNLISAHEGDKYKTKRKEFKDYKLDNECIPDNENGILKKDKIEVNYYYIHKSTGVKVNYIDESNNQVIDKDELQGYEGDEYRVKPKELQEYEIIEEKLPTNSKGKMTREMIEINYYYLKKSSIEVNYIDMNTNKIIEKETIEGLVNKEYNIQHKQILNYKIVKERLPSNAHGVFKEEVQKVNYYYLKDVVEEKKILPKTGMDEEKQSFRIEIIMCGLIILWKCRLRKKEE